jgi:gluconate 2-dehydrogenase alpha chain
MSERVDAIVVGAGVTGGIVSAELARAGAKVLCLDKGPHFSDDDFRFKHDEIRYYSRSAIVPKMATDPLTWRSSDRHTARILPWAVGPLAADEPLHLPPSIGTGGGSIHWGGASWRLREADFRMRSVIIERFGRSGIPENTSIVDWPYGYDDLEPYYDRAEWELGISGQAGNINGEIVPGGNPFEAPRRRDFPMPPLKRGAADHYFVEASERLGYHPFPQPAAIVSTDDFAEGRSGCVYCGFCHGFPCHVNAKTSTHNTTIPVGLATGNLEIRPFSRVVRVLRSESGREVRGVEYVDSNWQLHRAEASLVVLGCYTLENTRLLLVSGITGHGHTGKYFMTHNFGILTGLLSEYTNPFMGPLTAASVVDDFNAELIPENELGAVWGSAITSWAGDTQPIEGAHDMPPDAPRWGSGFKDWLRDNYRRRHLIYAQTPTMPSKYFYVDLDPNVKDPYGQPALRMTHDWVDHDVAAVEVILRVKRKIAEEMGMTHWWEADPRPFYHLSTHEGGTHRMGEDPSTSVVNPYGETHECKNLYVIGGGQFPTYVGYNPTTTIMAMAFLTAEHLTGKLPASAATARVERTA